MISQYNLPVDQRYGIKNLSQIVTKRLKMQGFIVGDPGFGPKYFHERNERIAAVSRICIAYSALSIERVPLTGLVQWLKDGSIKSKEDITEGIDHAADAFVAMLRGENFGKAILKIADPE